ncbi:dTDP-4-dehydrorhamnose reductase [Tunturiibacter lichenicola]|uniref:dTDP-4-dehydrorhamnose reductase n=1 Tax=Tunturiibacter lichenicola TaxID=2051959 RepID=UPI0021B43665|nr:dTDP-4-dehydrorhamnose reductase [Edaphobacter lichenicola]
MKVAVLGSNGQLGSDVCAAFLRNGDQVIGLTHSDIEVTSPSAVNAVLTASMPEFIVNTAAMHHVDKCEADPLAAFQGNAMGAKYVAQWAQQAGATIAYVSTDYVFDGKKGAPYLEIDAAVPLNTYGITKLAGENYTAAIAPKHFVLRVSAIYGHQPCRAKGGLNFVEMMLKLSRERDELRVVDDEFVSPTPTAQIAEQLVALSRSTHYGLYHATTEGSCSWYEFADEIFRATGTKIRLEKARPGEFPAKVLRPKYSVLENHALKAAQLNVFTDWRDGLEGYLRART